MHKLEITGATPEELYFNSVKMLALLLRPPQTVPDEPGKDASSAGAEPVMTLRGEGSIPSGADQASEGTNRSEPKEDEKTTVLPPKARRKNADPAILNDEIPDLGAKTLTLDGDIRPRLRAIQAAHTGRGNDMPTCVSYIQKLYGPFGITKADELKPEQFVEFMEASEAFVSGEA